MERHGKGIKGLLEIVTEWFFIQEDVWISELLVEPVFHLLDAGDDSVEIAIAGQHDDGSIGLARWWRRRGRSVVVFWTLVSVWGVWTHDLVFYVIEGRRLSISLVCEADDIVQRDLRPSQ